jgi:hypothetical protein
LPGTWTDTGLVLASSASNNYNAIDPTLNIVGSDWYLTFGSFWAGIFQVKLNPSTGKPVSGASISNIAQRPSSVGGAVEAPYIVQVRTLGCYGVFQCKSLTLCLSFKERKLLLPFHLVGQSASVALSSTSLLQFAD